MLHSSVFIQDPPPQCTILLLQFRPALEVRKHRSLRNSCKKGVVKGTHAQCTVNLPGVCNRTGCNSANTTNQERPHMLSMEQRTCHHSPQCVCPPEHNRVSPHQHRSVQHVVTKKNQHDHEQSHLTCRGLQILTPPG